MLITRALSRLSDIATLLAIPSYRMSTCVKYYSSCTISWTPLPMNSLRVACVLFSASRSELKCSFIPN